MSKDINEWLIDRICRCKNSIVYLRILMRERFKQQAFFWKN